MLIDIIGTMDPPIFVCQQTATANVNMQMPIIIPVLCCHIVLVRNVSQVGMGRLWQKQMKISRWSCLDYQINLLFCNSNLVLQTGNYIT
jgi:hypothetical protein